MKHMVFAVLGLGLFMSISSAQYEKEDTASSDIKIRKIEATLTTAPRYSLQGALPAADPSRKWLVVEADLLVAPEWADEVTLKFFVAAFYGSNAKSASEDGYDVLATSVTVVHVQRNVASARRALVPVFLDPNSVKKYEPSGIDKFIQDVVVQAYYKGVLQDTKWMKNPDNGRFWEKKQPRLGILLDLQQSPWFPAYVDHYEQMKPALTSPGL